MNRRTRTLLIGAVPIVAVGAVLASPAAVVPYAAEGPGPLVDVLGELDGAPAVEISGAEVDDPAGELDMTTVSVAHSMSLPAATVKWLDPEQDIVPIETIFPPGMTHEQVQERNAVAFTDSEASATIAALDHLGRPVEAYAAQVLPDSPAAGAVNEGDGIVAVGDRRIATPRDVVDAIGSHLPGDEVELTLARGGGEEKARVTLAENPDVEGAAQLGVVVGARPAGGLEIEYNVAGIGGPSAGLVLTLAVIDKLSPGDLLHGAHVAGTGTIDASGAVGPIGGITHKIAAARDAGADMFLVPEANCAEALTADAGDMPLLSVADVDAAIAALEDPAAAPTCG
ncbi:YlbL family protein [Corynebacterium sp. 335C]